MGLAMTTSLVVLGRAISASGSLVSILGVGPAPRRPAIRGIAVSDAPGERTVVRTYLHSGVLTSGVAVLTGAVRPSSDIGLVGGGRMATRLVPVPRGTTRGRTAVASLAGVVLRALVDSL